MTNIYKITNDINDKVYIGQTSKNIEERLNQHYIDSKKFIHRPMYELMQQYGKEHFTIELIEQVNDNNTDREEFWINYYNTYVDGYNNTYGGKGKHMINYNLVIDTYKQVGNITETAKKLNICPDSVSTILNSNNISKNSYKDIIKNKYGKSVDMYNKSNIYINTFLSISDAANYLIDNNLTNCKFTTIRYHITEVCIGKRKTAAKFIWRYHTD